MSQYAVPLLRAGLVVLFLWFGFSQVTNTAEWVAWVPPWTETIMPAQNVVLLNGAFELVLGMLLAAGFYVRIAALLLSLHLFFIAFEIGYNDIGMRDFALAVATLSLAMSHPDQWTLDKRLKKE